MDQNWGIVGPQEIAAKDAEIERQAAEIERLRAENGTMEKETEDFAGFRLAKKMQGRALAAEARVRELEG